MCVYNIHKRRTRGRVGGVVEEYKRNKTGKQKRVPRNMQVGAGEK